MLVTKNGAFAEALRRYVIFLEFFLACQCSVHIVGAFLACTLHAHRTFAAQSCPCVDLGFPFVPSRAKPPHCFLGAVYDLIRCERSIFLRMPLRGNIRNGRGKVIKTSEHFSTCAIRAVKASQRSIGNQHLVRMPLCTAPPCAAPASARHIGWSKRSVLFGVPFSDQFETACSLTIFVQCFFHSQSYLASA